MSLPSIYDWPQKTGGKTARRHRATRTLGGALFGLALFCTGATSAHAGTNGPFTAVNNATSFQTEIRVMTGVTSKMKYNAATIAGWPFSTASAAPTTDARGADELALWRTLKYLRDAVKKMTGKTLNVVDSNDGSAGIVLTTVSGAPADIATYNSQVASNGSDLFNANEAYYIRTETSPVRTFILANSCYGLEHGVVELVLGEHHQSSPMYDVGYEVLGMGPNWRSVPDFTNRPLIFWESNPGRPGYYVRDQWANSGQEHGAGTIKESTGLSDPADEPVEYSYSRWRTGTQMDGNSEPVYGPQQLLSWHVPVFVQMIANYDHSGSPNSMPGYLVPDTKVGPMSSRPLPSEVAAGTLFVDTANPTVPAVYSNSGTQWVSLAAPMATIFLDESAAVVRSVLFNGVHVPGYVWQGMKEHIQAGFVTNPDLTQDFNIESEDGGIFDGPFVQYTSDPNWWPAYRLANGMTEGPYKLHGTSVLPQPDTYVSESWWHNLPGINGDPVDTNNAQSDTNFALANYLLKEFDKYIDNTNVNLPPVFPAGNDDVTWSAGVPTLVTEKKFTATGKDKKAMVHISLASANFHDVPPNFNLDSRVRVQVMDGFSKHRAAGKWSLLKSGPDIAQAFKLFLPGRSFGAYWTIFDSNTADVFAGQSNNWYYGASGSLAAASCQSTINYYYNKGYKGLSSESDFDFGKLGLTYYMYAKMLWEPTMTAATLNGIRTRWIQRAYGPGATAMQKYYDLMTPENWLRAQQFFAQAMSYIDQAETAINSPTSPYQTRLDELRQYWYYYYLADVTPMTAQGAPMSEPFKEFEWKAQNSYITSTWMTTHKWFQPFNAPAGLDPFLQAGPTYAGSNRAAALRAHYTHGETILWWPTVKNHWPLNVTHPVNPALDLNDLVRVTQFTGAAHQRLFDIAAGTRSFLMPAKNANDVIGFKFFWPGVTNPVPPPGLIEYGIEYWDAATQTWQVKQDFSTTFAVSSVIPAPGFRTDPVQPLKTGSMVQVNYTAPLAGTYRFTLNVPSFALKYLTTLDYDLLNGVYTGSNTSLVLGLPFDNSTGGQWNWFYIPKGTTNLDLSKDLYMGTNPATVQLYTGLPSTGMTASGAPISMPNPFLSIPLTTNQAGSLCAVYTSFTANTTFAAPYMHSIPQLWNQQPSQLSVPRAIATADGLTPQ